MRRFASWAGRIRILTLPCLLVAASPLLLMAACGSAASPTPEEEPTLEGAEFRGTPVPTIAGTIGDCELGPKADCPGADFSNQDLGEVVLGWGQLDESGREGADLSEANLRGAQFVATNLEGIVFESADLREANFRLANLANASLFGADASGADFTRATLESGEFKDADLSGANFSGAVMKGGDFSRADLSGANLRGVSLLGRVPDRCRSQWRRSDRCQPHIRGCDRREPGGRHLLQYEDGRRQGQQRWLSLDGRCPAAACLPLRALSKAAGIDPDGGLLAERGWPKPW